MSRKGFWMGLLVGLIIMGLLAGTVAVVILGARWASGSKVALRGRSFDLQPGERGQLFGLRGRGGMGFSRWHCGLGALLCCKGLFLLVAAMAVAAFFCRRRCWHGSGGHHWQCHEQEPSDVEATEPADKPRTEEEHSAAAS